MKKELCEHDADSLFRRQTDPVWLQDYSLRSGHTELTNTATVTFIKRHDNIYAVTCRHVIEELNNPASVRAATQPTLALHIDTTPLNLSFIESCGRLTHTMIPVESDEQFDIDIAIALLAPEQWRTLVEKKNKTAIDLDHWREPDWGNVTMCVAVGYPNEHKESEQIKGRDTVTAGLARVTAEVTSTFNKNSLYITLSSKLDEPHGYFLSGMSGGPVYADDMIMDRARTDEEMAPVGIIIQGHPSTRKKYETSENDANASYLTDHDIFIRAITLTPDTFDLWLANIKKS